MGRKVVAALIVFAILLPAGAAYVVITTVRDLAPADDANEAGNSLWRLFLLSFGSAILTYPLVEFLKRQSPLRAEFNNRQLRAWRLEGVMANRAAPLRQLAAQLAQSYRQKLRAGTLDGGRVAPEALPELLKLAESDDKSTTVIRDGAEETLAERLSYTFEVKVDRFLLQSLEKWRRTLRWIAVLVAAGLSGTAAIAAGTRASVTVGAFAFGGLFGAPIAWTMRDIVRGFERRGDR